MTAEMMDVVHVHVDNMGDMQPAVPTQEHEPEHFVCKTFVLATASGVNVGGAQSRTDIDQILGLDPQRKDAAIYAVDTPIVLCHNAQDAQNVANQAAGVPTPQGAYIPTGGNASVSGTGPMWAVNTTPGTPCRVVVIINRRGSA